MKWSKLKKLTESRFAQSLQGKVAVHPTNYGCNCGRSWITYNGEQIANFETILHMCGVHKDGATTTEHGHLQIDSQQRKAGRTLEPGEMARWDLNDACWELVNELDIEEALASTNPVVRGLAYLDSRLGKKRAKTFLEGETHPLPRKLLEIRIREDAKSDSTTAIAPAPPI